MIKVKPTTKEQLVYHLTNNISLGTYDRRFLINLQTIKPVTTNQSNLLDKIVIRYAKQLRRQEIDANDMVNLPWGTLPIDSLPEYTDAFCGVRDGIIEVRSPYKKEFINEIKDSPIPVAWNRDTKIWTAPFCEYSLKHIIDCLDKHYLITRYDSTITEIIESFADFESATCWDPIYTIVNGNYMIAGINRILNDVLCDITLDAEPATLARLTSAGVKISPEVLDIAREELWNTDAAHKLIDFATTYNVVANIAEIAGLVQHLVEIKCDYVLVVEAFRNSKTSHVKELVTLLEENNIQFDTVTRNSEIDRIDSTMHQFPVIINTALWGMSQTVSQLGSCKTVFLGNNKPIEIK